MNIRLNGGFAHKPQHLTGVGADRDEHFSCIKLGQKGLDKDGKLFASARPADNQCASAAFNACVFSSDQSIDLKASPFTASPVWPQGLVLVRSGHLHPVDLGTGNLSRRQII